MSKILLARDVGHVLSDEILVFSSPNISPKKDSSEAKNLAESLHKNFNKLDLVISSDAKCLSQVLHNIQVKYNLSSSHIKKTSALNERKLGIMEGYPKNYSKDVFEMTRILPENGESIEQCVIRGYNCISSFLGQYPRILILSHPLMCQYLFNFMTHKDPTDIGIWNKSGAIVELHDDGIKWNFVREVQNERNN